MSSRKIFLPALHTYGHQTGESLLQVIRDIFAVRKNHKTGGNLGILLEKLNHTPSVAPRQGGLKTNLALIAGRKTQEEA